MGRVPEDTKFRGPWSRRIAVNDHKIYDRINEEESNPRFDENLIQSESPYCGDHFAFFESVKIRSKNAR